MKENTAARTMEVVLAEIKENISSFNITTDPAEKNKLELALKTLENEYNDKMRYSQKPCKPALCFGSLHKNR